MSRGKPNSFSAAIQAEDHNREIVVCKIVADAINLRDGTDYCAEPLEHDRGDACLRSASGRSCRAAEVVRVFPSLREATTNHNVRRAEIELGTVLVAAGWPRNGIKLNWSPDGKLSRVHPKAINELASLATKFSPVNGHVSIDDLEIFEHSPQLAQHITNILVYCTTRENPEVFSNGFAWLPRDGTWIQQAVAKKTNKYTLEELGHDPILIVDGNYLLDAEQISAYQASNPHIPPPFTELWIESMGVAYQVRGNRSR